MRAPVRGMARVAAASMIVETAAMAVADTVAAWAVPVTAPDKESPPPVAVRGRVMGAIA